VFSVVILGLSVILGLVILGLVILSVVILGLVILSGVVLGLVAIQEVVAVNNMPGIEGLDCFQINVIILN